ncbi:hypothetical protein BJ912DRAFT_706025 [Pholiota molesta]|nr:hypothetical protein BJ912DRAFT_706025 [Pholiota molesta]
MDAQLLQSRRAVLNPPYCQSTGIGGYLKELLYLTVANTILWCIVIALASNTLRATVKAKHIHSPRARRLLVIYISVMTIVSTISLGLMIQYTHKTLFSPFDGGIDARRHLETLISSTLFVTLPFAVFGADGLMVWRCWVLYNGVQRLLKFTLFCILIILLFVSLATIVWMYMPFINILLSVLPLLGATVMTNLLLSALILSRLLGHERWMKKTLGVHEKSSASPLRRIITICVESCGLIIACGLFVLAVIWHDSTLNLLAIPLTFLPHICAISPFLIIIRVANGRAPSSTNVPMSTTEGGEMNSSQLPPLRFAPPRPPSTTLTASYVHSDGSLTE